MLRYFKLYGGFLKFSFSRAMEFRVNFFFRILMDIIFYAVNIGFFEVLYTHTTLLAGWSREELMIFVGMYLTVDALVMTVFANNLWWLPHYVNKGDLDYYLIRPVSSLFFLSLRQFAADSFMNLLMAVGLLIYFILTSTLEFSFLKSLLLVGLLFNGACLYYFIQLTFILPVFWFQSSDGLAGLFYNTTRFLERPHSIYTGWMKKLLTTILPFCLVASYPADLLLKGFRWDLLLYTVGVTVCYFFAVRWLWGLSLRQYSSASS